MEIIKLGYFRICTVTIHFNSEITKSEIRNELYKEIELNLD